MTGLGLGVLETSYPYYPSVACQERREVRHLRRASLGERGRIGLSWTP